MTRHAAPSERIFALDALKGFAITCVVLAHAVLRVVPDPPSNAVYLALSAFEMPLFMFLSGYILPGRVRGSRLVWLRKRTVRLMVPFFAWHAIFFLSRRLRPEAWGSPLQLAEGLVRYLATTFAAPTAGLWYLPALLLCSIALVVYFPLRTRPLLLAAAGWLTFAALLVARDRIGLTGDYGLLKTSTYWVFFASGYAWGEWKRSLSPSRPVWRWSWALLYPFVAVPVMRAMPGWGAVGNGAAKVALGLAGTGFSAVLLEVADPVARRLRFDALGAMTLGLYCSQWLFLRADAWIVPRLGTGAAAVLALFAFTMAGSIATTMLIRKAPVARGILLGEWPRKPAAAAGAGVAT